MTLPTMPDLLAMAPGASMPGAELLPGLSIAGALFTKIENRERKGATEAVFSAEFLGVSVGRWCASPKTPGSDEVKWERSI